MARRRFYGSGGDGGDTDTAQMLFTKNLNRLMTAKGLSQASLTRLLQPFVPKGRKLERYAVNTWVNGKHMPDRINMEVLAQALKVKPSDLLPEGVSVEIVGKEEKLASLSMVDSGKARVKIDQELPTEIALQIMGLVTKASGNPA